MALGIGCSFRAMATTPLLPLDELTLQVLVDNETDTLSTIDDRIPQTPEGAVLAERLPVTTTDEGHRCVTVFDQLCVACHGFSVLVTGRRGEEQRTVLFDVGPYPEVWLGNAERHRVDLSAIETVFLSHWHFDHSGGFPEVVAAIAEARAGASLPPPVIDLHPDGDRVLVGSVDGDDGDIVRVEIPAG